MLALHLIVENSVDILDYISWVRLFIGEIPNSNSNYLNWAEMVQRNSDTETAQMCVLSRFPPVRLFVL